jgi:hypothetical protein
MERPGFKRPLAGMQGPKDRQVDKRAKNAQILGIATPN